MAEQRRGGKAGATRHRWAADRTFTEHLRSRNPGSMYSDMLVDGSELPWQSVEPGVERKVLRSGDSFIVGPDLVHEVVAVEAGILIDVFAPAREEFVRP